jgi:Tol biopolymer transport system component
MDFGLAKAMERPAEAGRYDGGVTASPTITTPAMTRAGMILGTAAYMSPEQARGRPVDKRADIWAFGVVVYEMLTGQRLFDAEDVSETLAAVLTRDLRLTALPSATSPRVRALVRDCLVRDPRQRLRDIGEARRLLDAAIAGAPDEREGDVGRVVPHKPVVSPGRRALPWLLVAGLCLVVVAGLLAWAPWRPVPVPPELRVDINTPVTDQPTSFALSPDGRQIVFVASDGGVPRLWIRSLAMTAAQPLAGTEGAKGPFWSPDSRSIAFFAGTTLKRLDLTGGAPQTLAPVVNGNGGAWNADGIIVFAPSLSTPLMRVSASGGAVTAVTALAPQQVGHLAPHFLPDGHRFLFSVRGASDASGIYLGALDGIAPTRLTPVGDFYSGSYLPTGWLLWLRKETLLAQSLDLEKATLTGEPVTMADGVDGYSVSMTGLVAYRTAGVTRRQLTWVDRAGAARGTVGDPDGTLFAPRVSPDGRRIAVSRVVQGNEDLWLMDGARTSRFTFDAGADYFPVWSPDGTRIVYVSRRTGHGEIYQKSTSGAGVEEPLLTSDQFKAPDSWSADGRFLLYDNLDAKTGWDILVLPMVGEHSPSAVLRTPVFEAWSVVSPDGRWVAYQSNESGRMDIYVRPFVPPSATGAGASVGQWQVSTAGGITPAWRRDGKELYYLNPAGALMAVPITVTGTTLEPGAPVVLFPTRIYGGGVEAQQGRQYDVAPDGRFLINTELDSAAPPITLLMNWKPPVKK